MLSTQLVFKVFPLGIKILRWTDCFFMIPCAFAQDFYYMVLNKYVKDWCTIDATNFQLASIAMYRANLLNSRNYCNFSNKSSLSVYSICLQFFFTSCCTFVVNAYKIVHGKMSLWVSLCFSMCEKLDNSQNERRKMKEC